VNLKFKILPNKIQWKNILRSKTLWKRIGATFAVLAVLWLAGCVYFYRVMCRPPEQFGSVMAKLPMPIPFLIFPFETMWMHARAGHLNVGDHAPDFQLTRLDKSAQIQLSSFTAQHRPVVLIFGSYT
jgi:hypothetical protein